MSTFIRSSQRISSSRKLNRVSWSADGSRLMIAGQEQFLRTWTLAHNDNGVLPANDMWLLEDERRRRRISSIRLAVSAKGDYFASVLPNYLNSLQVRTLEEDERVVWEDKLFDNPITVMAWSPVDDLLAVASDEYVMYVINGRSGEIWRTLNVDAPISCLAFSPDGEYLAVGTVSNPEPYVQIWEVRMERRLRTLRGHTNSITALTWWPDAHKSYLLASGSSDCTIRVWNWHTGQAVSSLERHMRSVVHLSVSHDGSVLASASPDESVCLWSRTRDFELMSVLNRPGASYDPCEIAFHPHRPLLAMVEEDVFVSVTDVDLDALHDKSILGEAAYYYSTAKVIVVGDGGVGKTALCHALQGEPFEMRYGTHSVNMWRLDAPRGEYRLKPVHREIFLWDLAGQEDYRLIHQLYLTNVSAALLVFAQNSRNSMFWGLKRWNQSLRQLEARERPDSSYDPRDKKSKLRKFLVQARADLMGGGIFIEEIQRRCEELDCEAFYVTSAKDNRGIQELHTALVRGIDWEHITQNVSTILFDTIRKFLDWLRESPDIRIVQSKRLYQMFLERYPNAPSGRRLWRQFETCLTFLEARQFLRRFDFGNLVLLRPELLHYYAASIIDAARQENLTDFGQVAESVVIRGQIPIPDDVRIANPEEDKWMLVATMQDLLRFEVAMVEHREDDKDESVLVFPSHFANGPHRPFTHEGYDELIYTFSGAVINLYAVLIVRLSRTKLFHISQLASNQAQFLAAEGGMCGITLEEDEDEARIKVFFGSGVSPLTRYTFDMFIRTYLRRHLPGSTITRTRVYYCANPDCQSDQRVRFDPQNVLKRLDMNKRNIRCPVCDELTPLVEEPITPEMREMLKSRVTAMNRRADQQRDRQAANVIFRAKQALGLYDVYFEGLSADAERIQGLVGELQKFGVYTLIERRKADEIAEMVKSVVFFVGDHEMGDRLVDVWRRRIRKYLKNDLTVVFAIYETQTFPGDLLREFTNDIDVIYFFGDLQDPDRLGELVRFITGKNPR